jgi:type IV pilus assembly protein PilB
MEKILTRKKKIGELLVEANLLSSENLIEALRLQKQNGKKLGQILVEQHFIKPSDLVSVLGSQLGIPHLWLRKGLVDSKIIKSVPYEKAQAYQVLPLFKVRNTLTLATADPMAVFILDELAKSTGCTIQPVLCRTDDIETCIEEYYRETEHLSEFFDSATGSDDLQVVERKTEEDIQAIEEMAEGSPVINMANTILLKAINDRASDIHIEPDRTKFRVRFRIDGILYEVMSPKPDIHPAFVSRLKIMAGLDIAERRLPQDGRIQVVVKDKFIDMRFSSLPGIFGEKVVLRVLDKSNAILDINNLGVRNEILEKIKQLLKRPYGLLLTTGPTGSGKTTTLYSAICFLNSLEKNIVTIEDPVEYQLDIINQNQTNDMIGLTFPRFLKHVLRQDPDIIMVGEIRDRETAEIAIQASLTGHLVLSTLHTNDACGAITRLLDMGIEPFMISSAVAGIIGQRLIRSICPDCKSLYYPSKEMVKRLGLDTEKNIKLAKGKGCDSCYDSGFKGRLGIYELVELNQELQKLILTNPSGEQLRDFIAQQNIPTIVSEGIEKVKEGITTLEEVNRAIHNED